MPLNFLSLVRHEVGGIIFYHYHLIQNERLKKELSLLREKLNVLEELSLENKRLRDILSLKQNSPYKVIVARVIGRTPDNWSSVIIVDKGTSSGIKEGMPVRDYLGLVGRVTQTSKSTSKIALLYEPNFCVSATVQRSRQEGLVCGTLGGFLVMKYLPKEADIRIADIIITSGLSENYPKGLIIGEVSEVGDEFSGLSRYALIKPQADLSGLEEVLVIVP